jgi:predicted ester cyclase
MDEDPVLRTARRNKQAYLDAKDAYNRRDLDACLAHYAADHQIMSQPTASGREHIRRFFEASFETWPDIQIVVENALAEGEWVMGRSVTTATHTAPVMGVAPTQRTIKTTFWDLHRFNDDGLIVQTWNLRDTQAIQQQVGLASAG